MDSVDINEILSREIGGDIGRCYNCGGGIRFMGYHFDIFILLSILYRIGYVIIISFFITLGFYLVYRHKKDEHPRKHAIKRSRPRWIIVALTPFVIVGISFIIDALHHPLNCGGYNCIDLQTELTFWEKFGNIITYFGFVIAIYFLITILFYLIYKRKKDEHPRKHAIKRSWPRWIIYVLLFSAPIIRFLLKNLI